jgi:hypothetical protein
MNACSSLRALALAVGLAAVGMPILARGASAQPARFLVPDAAPAQGG